MIVQTPPLGWNTWNTFGEKINEQLIRETADVMVSSGLLEAGYNYLVIDDCWSKRKRNEKGELEADPEKFPNGMKAVADYVHSKGLKFGMYSCCGTMTCAGYPGSYDYEFIDAKTFASWGVDLLKYDHCFKPYNEPSDLLYRKMGMALANSGRDILFSACSWGVNQTAEWIKSTGAHMWRSTGDIFDSWERIKELYETNRDLQKYNGLGCFNDMDMLVVGMKGKGNVAKGGCSVEEYRTHFSIWAMLCSPLMIGCDIRNMDEDTKAILLNREVLAVSQDVACRQPYELGRDVWVRYLNDGSLALLLVNLMDKDRKMFVSMRDIGLERVNGQKLLMHDLWTGEDSEMLDDAMIEVPMHGCRMFRCKIVAR